LINFLLSPFSLRDISLRNLLTKPRYFIGKCESLQTNKFEKCSLQKIYRFQRPKIVLRTCPYAFTVSRFYTHTIKGNQPEDD